MLRMERLAGIVGIGCLLVVLSPSRSSAADAVVTAPETIVRSAPFEVAPELTRLTATDRLPADEQPQGPWRRVKLPDGRYGFVKDADVELRAPLAPGAGAPVTRTSEVAASATAPRPPVRHIAIGEATPSLLGVVFALMPVGTLTADASPQGDTISNDSAFAVGVAPFIDFAVSPFAALGLSPQVIFRTRGEGATGPSATQLDLRGRVTGRAPVSPNAHAYGRLSPGYSFIFLPNPTTGASTPQGLLIDVSVGAEIGVLPKLFLVMELGYQIGFHSTMSSRYLHIGSGLAYAF